MAGTLLHSVRFDNRTYIAADGKWHYELVPIDGGYEPVSVTTWMEFVDTAVTIGIPADAWPVYESAIDIPLDDMHQRSDALRVLLQDKLFPPEECGWLWELVVCSLKSGEMIAYAIE